MDENADKLNLYSSHQIEHIFQIHLQPPFILEILIIPFLPGKNLGVTLSSNLSIEKHMCRSAYVVKRRISDIGHYLTTYATQTHVCAFVLSKLDYCNSLLSSCSNQTSYQTASGPNSAARLVFKARKQEHIKPLSSKNPLATSPLKNPVQYLNPVLQFFL